MGYEGSSVRLGSVHCLSESMVEKGERLATETGTRGNVDEAQSKAEADANICRGNENNTILRL
jgi:hypothetical protein